RGNATAAVEGDVELARQAVERARIQDVDVPGAGVGPRVDELLRVDAGGRGAGDVADIVGPRAAGDDPEVLDGLEQARGALGGDLADLQVGARRHVCIAAAVRGREQREARHLPVVEDAVGE